MQGESEAVESQEMQHPLNTGFATPTQSTDLSFLSQHLDGLETLRLCTQDASEALDEQGAPPLFNPFQGFWTGRGPGGDELARPW